MDRRGGWRRGCAIAAVIGCAVLALAILGGYLYDRTSERRVEAKLQEYRDAGQPVTWEEVLAARPQIPDDENAALVLLDAFDLLEELQTPGDRLIDCLVRSPRGLGRRNSPPMCELMHLRLEAKAEVLRLIHEAAQLEAAVYPLDASVPPWEADRRYLSLIRGAAWLLQVRAVVHAQDGRPAEAAAVLLDWAALPASLDTGVTMIDVLVRIAIGAMWTGATEETLALCELPAEDLHTLRAELLREEGEWSLELPFYGERAMGHWIFAQAAPTGLMGGNASAEAILWRLHWMIPGRREKDALLWYDTFTEAACVLRLPLLQRLGAARRLTDEVERALGKSPKRYLLSAMLMPAFGRAVEEEVRAHARLRVAGAALAVEEWRMAHGGWPESLDALVPELLEAVPVDLFSGEPLRYRRRDGGVVIYSIGPDEKDDGGVAYDEAQEKAGEYGQEGWDIAFRLLDPERRGAQATTFRDEVMAASYLSLEELEEAGFPRERLLELGLTEEDLMALE